MGEILKGGFKVEAVHWGWDDGSWMMGTLGGK